MSPNRESVPARYLPPEEYFAPGFRPAGSFTIREYEGRRTLHGSLPGGNACACSLQPETPNGWIFNEDQDRPTLAPSVKVSSRRGGRDVELWHGWLRNGEWVSC